MEEKWEWKKKKKEWVEKHPEREEKKSGEREAERVLYKRKG